ncbi:LysR family transcriptional regulator [Pseudomonas sp. RIT412]|nr:LysR family transcriptional regulator [Pseudomonas sp. RIT 409]RAU55540.1 LysR family transcriptional regulator [Pseudomonas sp. RIT 412]
MDIRELRSFIHIARLGSFSRAAIDLHIAQPALSRQVAKLEEEIGESLFVRHGRGVRLTSAGASLLERAEMIVNLVAQTGEHVRASKDNLTGHLALGLPPAVGIWVAPAIVEAFKNAWPAVGLHIREGLSSSLQEWVLDRRVDIAVVYNQPPLDALHIAPLNSEPMVLISASGDAHFSEIGRESLTFREVADLPLIAPAFPHADRRVLEQAAAQHGAHLHVALEVDSVSLTKELVAAGHGYAVITQTAVQREIDDGKLRAIAIERPPIRSVVSIVTLREQQPSRLVQAASEIITHSMRSLVTEGAWYGYTTWLGE